MSFSSLKQASAAGFEKMAEEAYNTTPAGRKANQEKQKEEDPRFWYPRRDAQGNAHHIVRFLPAPVGEHPWVEWWDFGFEGPTGKWYFARSLRSIGKPDPCAEFNGELWKQGEGSPGRAQARNQKQKTHYTVNIQVIQDGIMPENNGKVFMWVIGKKVFEKIASAMRPEFADEPKFNPFDLWGGADFHVKVREVDGWANYDKSHFAPVAAHLGGNDVALEAVFSQVHSLQAEYKDPSKYESYDALKARLHEVLSLTPSGVQQLPDQLVSAPPVVAGAPVGAVPTPTVPQTPAGTPVASSTAPLTPGQPAAGQSPMDYFKQLAQEAANTAKVP